MHLTRTLAARCPNAKFGHKKSLCFTETIIFQLLCCLYLYDSGMLGPVCIRKKQRLYTVFRRGSTIHRAAGIPSSGACGNEPFERYTAVWQGREVFAKSVYRLLAFKGLKRPCFRYRLCLQRSINRCVIIIIIIMAGSVSCSI